MICNNLSKCIDERLDNKVYACIQSNKCVEVDDTRSIIKCEEKGKKYLLGNPDRDKVLLYRIDGEVVKQDATVPPQTNKCDYLFTNTRKMVVLVELKGEDVDQALKQIDGTLKIFKEHFKTCSYVYGRAVVASATPRISASPQFLKLLLKLKALKGDLKISERIMQESIKDLC